MVNLFNSRGAMIITCRYLRLSQTPKFGALQKRLIESDAYGSGRYTDRFRPPLAGSTGKTDTRDFKYSANHLTQDRQQSSALRSNPYEGSRTYGRDSSASRWSNDRSASRPFRSEYSGGSQLRPINWDTEKLSPFEKNFYKERPEVAARTVEQIRSLLQEQKITIEGKPPIPKPIMTFDEAGFPSYIQQEIDRAQFKEPSAIQKIGFPVALSGRDFIGVSRTGSGKTLAFILPGLVHIDAQPPLQSRDGPIVLILAPTRELACQIHKEASNFGHSRNIRATAVYGGVPKYSQEQQLRNGAEIVVACPGRLMDLLEGGATNLKRTTFLVLDEADRMLDMGFEPQIRRIVSQIRPDRQTLMYSATWPHSVNALARDFCREEPVQVKIGSLELHANPDVSQQIMMVSQYEKNDHFMRWISKTLASQQDGPAPKILVFCSTRNLCDRIAYDLINDGKGAVAIHGQKSQNDRDRAINDFRHGSRQVLVATDVAARGLDINDVTAVVNYDLPGCIEDYVHRIGRTARAGKKGISLTFFPKDERSVEAARMAREISNIMRLAGQQPPEELSRYGAR